MKTLKDLVLGDDRTLKRVREHLTAMYGVSAYQQCLKCEAERIGSCVKIYDGDSIINVVVNGGDANLQDYADNIKRELGNAAGALDNVRSTTKNEDVLRKIARAEQDIVEAFVEIESAFEGDLSVITDTSWMSEPRKTGATIKDFYREIEYNRRPTEGERKMFETQMAASSPGNTYVTSSRNGEFGLTFKATLDTSD